MSAPILTTSASPIGQTRSRWAGPYGTGIARIAVSGAPGAPCRTPDLPMQGARSPMSVLLARVAVCAGLGRPALSDRM
jgi:hypothetical protein